MVEWPSDEERERIRKGYRGIPEDEAMRMAIERAASMGMPMAKAERIAEEYGSSTCDVIGRGFEFLESQSNPRKLLFAARDEDGNREEVYCALLNPQKASGLLLISGGTTATSNSE